MRIALTLLLLTQAGCDGCVFVHGGSFPIEVFWTPVDVRPTVTVCEDRDGCTALDTSFSVAGAELSEGSLSGRFAPVRSNPCRIPPLSVTLEAPGCVSVTQEQPRHRLEFDAPPLVFTFDLACAN